MNTELCEISHQDVHIEAISFIYLYETVSKFLWKKIATNPHRVQALLPPGTFR